VLCYESRPGFDRPWDRLYRLNGPKTVVNMGSVGQPPDDDRRACHVLLDGEVVHLRRVDYDGGAAIRKIEEIGELGKVLGGRLRPSATG
jgi:diadenosine tetraphosphatase ApaH/serine/threonine PP2A family protein phosphatase